MVTEDVASNIEIVLEESQVKMSLIRDYLYRFAISDPRLVAPIMDVDRCLSTLDHLMGHDHNHDHRHDHMPEEGGE